MRFEPYQETKKTVKVAPVRIVQNQHDQNGSQPQTTKYPQLNLQFQFQKCFTPAVTIPLSFLQQLIQQAQSNKILNQIGENKTVQQEQSEAVNNLITQIQYQKQGTSKSQDSNEDSPIRLYLIKSQMKFITEDTTSIDKVKLYFADNQNLLPHFWAWINSIEFKALEEMLMLCYSNPSNTKRIQDIFKSLFQTLSIEFFQKHAYAQILRSNLQDKIKYLSVIGDILSKIMNPQDYFYFNKQ
ncbi:unnamed protein product (macronuclear) [Paramecium tetraurelia]|uniref:Ras-GEF domain-containing protein n=1 Tax=Paramecium tetraurelia TaxID=5888 RepID=A0CSM0_PARTE|nr:uncharacterized protein GSPATT00010059001 [Paramecium tetraurelia]CAK73787.1 unnamed protein product [Paramecium tetraurelia]|eukprot:XP_001441184.1 hypothetical protein (macronuclear) [Paramecium tetraurelia strain d4-2]